MGESKDLELHETKAKVFETWGVINRSFEQIISGLNKLQKMGVLEDDYVIDQDTITNDLWSRINYPDHQRREQPGRRRPRSLWEDASHD